MTLEWDDCYATGYVEIDAQHRHLFELLNEMVQVNAIDDLKPLLMLLYQHTREHFQHEENLMRCADFPGLANHINGHNYLLQRLNAFSVEIGQGRFNKSELVKLMTDWAMNHIIRNDIPALASIARPG